MLCQQTNGRIELALYTTERNASGKVCTALDGWVVSCTCHFGQALTLIPQVHEAKGAVADIWRWSLVR